MRGKDDRLVAVGRIGAPHGVQGQLRVKSYTGDPMALGSYGSLSLAGGRQLSVRQLRFLKEDMVVASFAGIAAREAAEDLTGSELYVPRHALPPANEDEFYHADLIGLEAKLETGGSIGKIVAIHNFGAGDILEIAMPGAEAWLMPFTKAVVPSIDFDNDCLTIVPPGEVEATGE